MPFVWIVTAVLGVSQLLWGVAAWGLHWWLKPILPAQIRVVWWILLVVLAADGLLYWAYKATTPMHWRWIITYLLIAFYGLLFTLFGGLIYRVAGYWINPDLVARGLRVSMPIALALLLGLGWYNAYVPHTVYYPITLDKPLARPLRIALISDTHFGALVGHHHIRHLTNILETVQPDMLLLAGDIMDDLPQEYERQGMADSLQQIRLPLGQYAVLGNHDNYRHVQSDIVNHIEQGGFQVLRDERVLIDHRVWLVGRRDKEEPRLPAADLVPESTLPIILLDHQPEGMTEMATSGADLILSGHTHGGQVFPGTTLVRLFQRYIHGHYILDQAHLIVTTGLGLWGVPLRLGTRSEVVIIELSGS